MDLFFSAVMSSTLESDADAVMNAFIESKRNVNSALQTKNRIEQMRAERARKEEEARAAEAIRRAQMEAQRQQIVEEPGPTGPIPAQNRPENQPSEPIPGPAPKKTVGGRLIMEVSHPNKAMFEKLANFMIDNGFTFKRIG